MKAVRTQRKLGKLLSVGLLGAVGACAQIAGIEDRPFEESEASYCDEYCDLVGNQARALEDPEDGGVCPTLYSSEATCLGVCNHIPVGDPVEPENIPNSQLCRLNAAKRAKAASEGERDDACQAAGPGGNGVCGSNCESYCMLVEQDDVCGEINPIVPNCVEKCEAFGDSNRFSVAIGDEQFDHSGDTVQCRLVHVSSATVGEVEAEEHCPHAYFHSNLWCYDEEPSCKRYCDIQEVACQGKNAIYDNRDQCEATCAVLDLGDDPFDDAGDNIACRTWHAVSALEADVVHCHHAGPTGDGHCGKDTDDTFSSCRPYCKILQAACDTEFSEKWDNLEDCYKECDQSDESFGAAADAEYNVANAKTAGDSLICRTYYGTRALGDPNNRDEYCPSAFGAAPCD